MTPISPRKLLALGFVAGFLAGATGVAALFGEASWAEHVLDDKMARTPAAVAA